jgi:hypothetical protein
MSEDSIADEQGDYEIGYRKPPKRSRFKKGQSGNPKGRPRGAKSLITLLMAELEEKISVNENGRSRRLTKREALVKQLVNKAVMGGFREFRILSELVRPEEQRITEALSAAKIGNSPSDRVRRRIDELAERMRLRYGAIATSDKVPPTAGDPSRPMQTEN